MKLQAESQLQLLLVVLGPPPGVQFAVQRGRDELLPAFAMDAEAITFAITLRLGLRSDGSFDFRGPYAQGVPHDRFVYVNSGVLAGQAGTHWERRAKIKLLGIPAALVESAAGRLDLAIEGRIVGTARDGGPVCASVKPPDITWQLRSRPGPT